MGRIGDAAMLRLKGVYNWTALGHTHHTAAQPTQQASRQINSLLMTLHSCYLLSIDDNFPIETRQSKDLLLKPMHSRLKINIWYTNVKDVNLVLQNNFFLSFIYLI